MSQTDRANALRNAYRLIRENQRDEARLAVRELLKTYPKDADVLYLASLLVSDPARKMEMLQRALDIDPFHERSMAELDKLKGKTPKAAPAKKKSSNNGALTMIGVVAVVLAVIIGGGLVVSRLNQPQPAAQIVAPTALITSTTVVLPSATATLLPTETPLPTTTPTPPPFGYTATADWHAFQTSEADFRLTMTSAALTQSP